MNNLDLNASTIVHENGNHVEISDHSAMSRAAEVNVYFRDLESQLVSRIERADLIVGCVAWMTNERILRALAAVKSGVAIVVQKEDFLRPDLGRSNGWKSRLRSFYESLKNPIGRYEFGGLIGDLSQCGDPSVQPVRCVGNHNRDKNPAFPRMHHKFLVFCRVYQEIDPYFGGHFFKVAPHEVWTGSFNLTANAARSLENAVVIRDQHIVESYYAEWMQIEALSEPLDWTADWCAPEWRIGS